MRTATKRKTTARNRIEVAYYQTCKGVQINIMDIPKVFAEGERLIAEGVDDIALAEGIRAFVETIRQN